MLASIFLKKLIFFFSTGTVIFYLISFNSSGQPAYENTKEQARFDCQENVRIMNYNRLQNLRSNYSVTHQNILKLTIAEQRGLSHYLKEMKMTIVKNGLPNPLRLTSYSYEAKNRQTLGYKIIIDSIQESHDVVTYFVGKNGNILFFQSAGVIGSHKWFCEANQYL